MEVKLKTLMSRALDLAKVRGAQYADVRIVHNRNESISVRDGIVEGLNFAENEGFGVRVLVDGAWVLLPAARSPRKRSIKSPTRHTRSPALRRWSVMRKPSLDLPSPARAFTQPRHKLIPSVCHAKSAWQC